MVEGISLKEAKQYVGRGWWRLLDRFYGAKPRGAFVSQVKEKFGELRIYCYSYTVDITDLERLAEEIKKESVTICEFCGSPGARRSYDGWIKTTCEICDRERRK